VSRGDLLGQNKAMPYSIHSDGPGFASIIVPAENSWWWLYNATPQSVGETLSQNHASLTWISGTGNSFCATMNSPGPEFLPDRYRPI
jgi:hypothetical protein